MDRAAKGKPMPGVQLRAEAAQRQERRVTRGEPKRTREAGGSEQEEEERDAMVKFVVEDLAPELPQSFKASTKEMSYL